METMHFFGHFFIEHTNGTRVRIVYKDDNGLTIGLRNIKEHPDLSDETTCFSANVDFDGKKVGTASNDGRGGCSLVNIDKKKDWDRFQSIAKPKDVLAREDIIDWLVILTLDFRDNIKKNYSLRELQKGYPVDGLW